MEEYPEEQDEGNHEYKWHLTNLSRETLAIRSVQMQTRLVAGKGEAIYSLGVRDDGTIDPLTANLFQESLDNLIEIASMLKATVTELKTESINEMLYGDFLIRSFNELEYTEIRAGVAGNVDSGKSTLIGVLAGGKPDNGRGSARNCVMNHQHEMESGRTTDVSYSVVGFDSEGRYVNSDLHKYRIPEVIKKSSKIITMIDLPGHRGYSRTTVSGINSLLPDIGIVVVNINSEIKENHTTLDHMRIFDVYNVPFIIVATKIDITSAERKRKSGAETTALVKSINSNYKLFRVNKDNISFALNNFGTNIIPVFTVSSTTMDGYDVLKEFLSKCLSRKEKQFYTSGTVMPVVNIYSGVKSAGMIISGVVHCGSFQRDQTVFLGPDGNGDFRELEIKSLEINYERVRMAIKEDHVALSFKNFPRGFRPVKGMVLLGSENKLESTKILRVKIKIMENNKTRISPGSCPVGFVNNRRVTFKVLEIGSVKTQYEDSEILRQGDTAIMILESNRYVYAPSGTRIIFHEGDLSAVGKVKNESVGGL